MLAYSHSNRTHVLPPGHRRHSRWLAYRYRAVAVGYSSDVFVFATFGSVLDLRPGFYRKPSGSTTRRYGAIRQRLSPDLPELRLREGRLWRSYQRKGRGFAENGFLAMLGENHVVHEVRSLIRHRMGFRRRTYENCFFRVFNSITKTVGQCLSPSSSPSFVTWNFLVESLTKVVRTILLCMETENVDEELIITGV